MRFLRGWILQCASLGGSRSFFEQPSHLAECCGHLPRLAREHILARMDATIYHNPRCSKSRKALQRLRDAGLTPQIIEYLKAPLDADQVRAIAAQLHAHPAALIRTGESIFGELEVDADELTEAAAADLIAAHPRLLQRPIVIVGDQAVVARPPERLDEILP